ncbi:hypothetical protein F4778DRAFT_793146 [Xylariomycetidae sp. FL2044]|nr:hypothetical protein F4778DRAFT_793146 [Xylariomycetidae sp. FL2044]
MLSLASLLNPAPPGPSVNRFPPSPASSSPTTSFADESAFLDRPIMPKHKMPKDAAVFTKSKPKGVVNFRPFERLDEASLRMVRQFHVYPIGKIQECCRHIPYNSGKKDFYEKTRRESFEVFQYVFRVPGDNAEYVVMWDYNVGLVRMTPFFKCCKYPKTTPAKMLNSNPGLKEITHSITGGSIMAQGYWMPYHCAKAVCATFCHNIAGALIPIFGPDFPSLCTPSDAPEYSRMIIDPSIVVQSARDAEHFRRMHRGGAAAAAAMMGSGGGQSPKRDRRVFKSPYDDSSKFHPRHRIRKAFMATAPAPGCETPYATDTEGDISPATERFHYSPLPPIAPLRPPPPPTSSHTSGSGWTPVNMQHPHYDTPGPSPWLSAVPRFTTTAAQQQHHHHHHYPSHTSPHQHHHAPIQPPPPPPPPPPHQPQHLTTWRPKRPAEHLDREHDISERSQHNNHQQQHNHHHQQHLGTAASRAAPTRTSLPTQKPAHNHHHHHHHRDSSTAATAASSSSRTPTTLGGADKNAALLLMNLSVRDSSSTIAASAPSASSTSTSTSVPAPWKAKAEGGKLRREEQGHTNNKGDGDGGGGGINRAGSGVGEVGDVGTETGVTVESSRKEEEEKKKIHHDDGGAFLPRVKRVRSNSM